MRRMDLPFLGGRLSGRVNTVKLSVKLCKTLNQKLLIVPHRSLISPAERLKDGASMPVVSSLSADTTDKGAGRNVSSRRVTMSVCEVAFGFDAQPLH